MANKFNKDQLLKAEAVVLTALALYFGFGTDLPNSWDFFFTLLFGAGAIAHYYWWIKKG